MLRPVSTEQAYRLFGMLLGLLPPVAIFYKLFSEMGGGQWFYLPSGLFMLLAGMVATCCLVGRVMGAVMGRWLEVGDGVSWARNFFKSFVAGIAWGAVTGAAGGLPAFGIGAFCGLACAIAVAVVAFPMFALLHRLLARGDMIDARHFWPLACGVVGVISALILNL